ncbi:hypothetical protein KY290_035462 [Solanum tuberosum]|uniref:Uncharacterized protein n=1 Tax=Solanum tuberosum TaxID=4113 RepID=A0ABQ7U655_SOLTU|nr:hypothetical protein KY289_034959 [Solanum tuberosum]KAH0646017.1 hypothetical protein KY284_033901 [Solanum tuberosum]KAH0742419.1 hypothetical protein KY290_035462 [Solanum tuberosum]
MGNRRNAMVAVSDDEDDVPLSSRSTRASSNGEEKANQRKRKKVRLDEEEEEEEEANNEDESRDKRRTKRKVPENEENEEEEEEEERGRGKRIKKLKKVEEEEEEPEPVKEEEEEEQQEDAKPIGEVIRVTGKGKGRKTHYESFEYDGNRYELEDPVLLVPEGQLQKPYVAIIKDITQTKDGNLMVTGQWFYRPEEALKRAGGSWQSRDTRELFYSFHRDAVPAESVMHKCVVHFIPLNKEIPRRKEHPGFIVQKVYDTEQRRLFKLTDKDYEDTKQHEIDLLVQKTIARVGHLPDLETEDNSAGPVSQEDQLKNKRLLRKKSMMSLDVTRDDEAPSRSGQPRAETPGSCANNASEYFIILSNFKVLTGETQRDKWLEKLLQSIQYFCSPVDNVQNDGRAKGGSDAADLTGNTDSAKPVNESLDNGADGDVFRWPDSAVTAVVSLEKAAHEALSSDFQKYNQKMRQLTFNLKNTSLLARRLLKGELDPSQILNMSPNELKEALTAEELASKEPEEPEPIQMTDARCNRCTEKKVRLMEIIQAGHGDHYSLECIACGNTWYASRDEAASLTIDGPNSAKSVGTEPLATAKFEDVEKNLTSPRKADKGANDILKKTTEAYMPVLDSQRSFNKTKPEDNTTTGHAD